MTKGVFECIKLGGIVPKVELCPGIMPCEIPPGTNTESEMNRISVKDIVDAAPGFLTTLGVISVVCFSATGGLGDVIDAAPWFFAVLGLGLLLYSSPTGGNVESHEKKSRMMMPGITMLACGAFVAVAPTVLIGMSGHDKGQLSVGEYVQKNLDEKNALRERKEPQPSQLKLADSGDDGNRGADSDSQPAPLSQKTAPPAQAVSEPTVAAKPVVEKLATPEEARSAADAKALWELAIGVVVAFLAGGAACLSGRARQSKAAAKRQALPEVQFSSGVNKGSPAFGDPNAFGQDVRNGSGKSGSNP